MMFFAAEPSPSRRGSSSLHAFLATAVLTGMLFSPARALAEDGWGMDLDGDDQASDGGAAPPTIAPEYRGDTVEPASDAPTALVVVGGADAVAERFALDLQRIFAARLDRTAALIGHDANPILLAGEGGDPEVRLLQARAHAGRGLEHYHNLELDEAVESFHDALHRYGQAFSATFDPVEMANAYLMLGATHFVAGNRQQAQEAFRQALILDPGHEPDKGFFSPPLLEAFDGARWEIGAMQAGSLTITATPAHAEIWVNGVFRGMAPLTLTNLPVGTIFIMARQRGFAPRVEVAVTLPGEPLRVDLGLRAGAGTGIYTSYRDSAVAEIPSAGLRMPESVGRLAEMFPLDRILVGQVKSGSTGRTAQLRVYDVGVGLQMAETTFDLLELDHAGLVQEVDLLLRVAAGPAPEALPDVVAKPPRQPLVLPAPADDWRFWAATGAGMAVIAGSVALIAMLSGGETAPPQPTSHWPVIRIPPP